MYLDVYMLCPKCDGITDATRCDIAASRDLVTCTTCGEGTTSLKVGKFIPFGSKPERDFYVPASKQHNGTYNNPYRS
jgi:hypothetical protein